MWIATVSVPFAGPARAARSARSVGSGGPLSSAWKGADSNEKVDMGYTAFPERTGTTNWPTRRQPTMAEATSHGRRTAAACVREAPGCSARQSRTALVDGATRSDFERRWESVQGEFIDDPRRAVADAGSLVADLIERMHNNLTKRGSELGQQGAGDPDTEAMRVELRQYKAIFHTLLHGDDGQPKAPPKPPAPGVLMLGLIMTGNGPAPAGMVIVARSVAFRSGPNSRRRFRVI